MADKATATKSSSTTNDNAASDNSAAISAKLDEVRDLLVQDGMDPATAEALTNYPRPGSPTIVGNLADLQRMGAIAVQGEVPANAMPTGDQTPIKTSNTADAFAEPPQATPDNAQPITAEISAAAAKADESTK